MLRIDNLSLPLSWDMTVLTEVVLRKLRIPADMLQSVTLAKKSLKTLTCYPRNPSGSSVVTVGHTTSVTAVLTTY